jgi:chromosome partitioning protein
MYTIVAASQKGGSGKTTLSGHLAVEASRAGRVKSPDRHRPARFAGALVECPHRARAAFRQGGLARPRQALEGLRRMGIKIAVIDTPPAITQSISQVVAHADLVIVPTRPARTICARWARRWISPSVTAKP